RVGGRAGRGVEVDAVDLRGRAIDHGDAGLVLDHVEVALQDVAADIDVADLEFVALGRALVGAAEHERGRAGALLTPVGVGPFEGDVVAVDRNQLVGAAAGIVGGEPGLRIVFAGIGFGQRRVDDVDAAQRTQEQRVRLGQLDGEVGVVGD